MEQWPEHSVQAYLTRLPTYKLELILDAENSASAHSLLTQEDYARILALLRARPDSRYFEKNG